MSSTASALCPACRSAMVPAPLRWKVLTCPTCGGVWTDAAASARIALVMDRDLVNVGRDAAKNAQADISIDDRVRRCPVCQGALVREKVVEVTLDTCAAHGTWFDRDELGRVARNLDVLRTTPARDRETPSSVELVSAMLGE